MSTFLSPEKKKRKVDIPEFLREWENIYTSGGDMDAKGWGEFYLRWWGSNGEAIFQRILAEKDVASENRTIHVNPWRPFKFLQFTQGWMIMRDEFHETYERLFELSKTSEAGVVLIGNPGIGKSYFGLYTLLRRMAERKTTLFTTSKNVSYLFHDTGVRRKKADVDEDDLPPYDVSDPTTRAWSIIDAGDTKMPKKPGLDDPDVFVLIVSSPKEEKYKVWRTQSSGLLWVMNPWSVEEISAFLSNPMLSKISRDRYKTLNVRQLMDDFGPCPRDIRKALKDPSGHNAQIDAALGGMTIDKFVTSFTQSTNSPDAISHKVALLVRDNDDEQNLDTDDRIQLRFKTETIQKWADEKLRGLVLQKQHVFFLGVKGSSRQVAGLAFETIVIQYLRGDEGWNRAFQVPLVRMSLPSTKESPRRFSCICPGVGSPSSTTSTVNLPIGVRSEYVYVMAESLQLDTRTLYIPRQSNNPTFDCFFLESSGKGAALWVFQLTVRDTHDGRSSGLRILKDLQEKMKSAYRNATINLVLVTPLEPATPLKARERKVSWSFDEDVEKVFDGCRVYTQFVTIPLTL